jgi:hypothetical protein
MVGDLLRRFQLAECNRLEAASPKMKPLLQKTCDIAGQFHRPGSSPPCHAQAGRLGRRGTRTVQRRSRQHQLGPGILAACPWIHRVRRAPQPWPQRGSPRWSSDAANLRDEWRIGSRNIRAFRSSTKWSSTRFSSDFIPRAELIATPSPPMPSVACRNMALAGQEAPPGTRCTPCGSLSLTGQPRKPTSTLQRTLS